LDSNVSVIETTNYQLVASVPVGLNPIGLSISPNGNNVYVANSSPGTVSIIDTATNQVTQTINVGISPFAVSVSSDGSRAYITNRGDNTVSVINTNDNTSTVLNSGLSPFGVSVLPDGTNIYVTSFGTNNVTVINTSSNTISATIPVAQSYSLGNFIATVTPPTSIPTLSQWTQIALAFMTFGLVFWYQKRESV
jgi:YVTN family beta-propeller protein